MSPLCPSCIELIESIGGILRSIQDMEVKIKCQQDVVINLLRQDCSMQFPDEQRIHSFCPAQFRVSIQEKLNILPYNPMTTSKLNPWDVDPMKYSGMDDEDSDCKLATTDDEIDPLTIDVEIDPLEIDDEVSIRNISSSQKYQVENPGQNVKYNLPEGVVIRNCSVRLEKLRKTGRKPKSKECCLKRKREGKAVMLKDPKKPIPCKYYNSEEYKCSQFFPDDESMIEHVRRIHLITDFNCRQCEHQFESRKTFFKHQVTIHGEPYPFLCKEDNCGRGFMYAMDLKYHMVSHTGGPSIRKKRNRKVKERKDPSKTIPCKYVDSGEKKCCQYFADEQSMMAHVRIVHLAEDCTCGICGVSFEKKLKLLQHKVKIHGEPLPYFCKEENCGQGFMYSSSLKSHMYSHTGEYPYRCDKCSSGFAELSKLKEHSNVHLSKDASNFVCEVCGKTCKSLKLVTLHQRYHFQERAYNCTLCSWSFKNITGLKNHMKSIHSDDNSRPHLCQECGAAFKLKYQLTSHLKRHGNRKLKFSHRKRHTKPAPSCPPSATASGEN
ncbi:unnamed protein product [Allacma fusca]|uniref:C2H2-type domain-containing protein n=1 Tax=Allacma fusca TaxID=39272 RepID=A0A8J2J0M6_9HEXA|nr:unnamed protein product [Allacma fusca]